MEYKGYEIITGAVCFDVRWFIYGEGEYGNDFFGRHFESYEKACEAIDEYIVKTFLENKLDEISKKLDIKKEVILKYLSRIMHDLHV